MNRQTIKASLLKHYNRQFVLPDWESSRHNLGLFARCLSPSVSTRPVYVTIAFFGGVEARSALLVE